MTELKFDFLKTNGKIQVINAVNNGPAGSKERGTGNSSAYEALEIPYARNHDAAFYAGYGGEHTVDVNNIFPNFYIKCTVRFLGNCILQCFRNEF